MRGHRDLVWACAGAVICGLGALLIPVAAISFVFLAPLAFLLTGYAILSVALPRWRAEPPLKASASLGVSLAVLALGSLLLNYVGGLRSVPWTVLLVVIVIACARGAAIRRPREEGQRIVLDFRRPSVFSVLAVILGLLAAGASLAFAFHPVSAPRAIGYSELWINTGASEDSFEVGVGNQEHTPYIFGLIATVKGAETIERHVELNPGERQVLTLPVEGRTEPGPLRVHVTLYREGIPNQPYRSVSGWVPSRSAGP